MLHLPSRKHLLLLSIVALATFFRFYHLDLMPPGFQFDQAFYVFDSLRLLQGSFYIFFDAPGGSEPLFLYAAMPWIAVFGVSPLGIKLTSAIIGVVTIPLVYLLARSLFRSTQVGLLSSFFMAISIWDIFYGRYGERITLLVLLVVPLFLFLWRAINRRNMRYFAFVGIFLGLGLYTNLAARVLPFAVVLTIAYMIFSDRVNARVYLHGLLLAGLVTLVIFAPLGMYFISHPDQFISHTAQVSIFVPHAAETGNVPESLARNFIRLSEMFFIRGDDSMIRNVPYRPIFDPLTALLFIFGVFTWGSALISRSASPLERRRAMLILIWLFVGMAVSLVSDDAPNFSRLHPIIPVVMFFPAWGGVALWDWTRRRSRDWAHRRNIALTRSLATMPYLAFLVVAVAGITSSYQDYFVKLANDPGLYYAFNVDKVDFAGWVNERAPREHVFVAPLSWSIGTVSLLTRNAPLKSFESRDTIVLPSAAAGKDAVYSFPIEQERKAETMLSRLGPLASKEGLLGSNGASLMLNLRVPLANLPTLDDPWSVLLEGGAFVQPQTNDLTSFGGEIELLGHTISPEGPGGRNLTVNLFLRASRSVQTEYTFSLKVRDEKGRVWGQEDKWAGDNSFPTTLWARGDVIVEKFYPGLAACAPPGKYEVSLEIYNPITMAVLPLTGREGNLLTIGSFSAGPSAGNRHEDLEVGHPLELTTREGATLIGYTLSPEQLRLGESFSLSLFWSGNGQALTVPISASLGGQELVFDRIQLPPEGRGLCTFYDLALPANALVGSSRLAVNGTSITQVEISR